MANLNFVRGLRTLARWPQVGALVLAMLVTATASAQSPAPVVQAFSPFEKTTHDYALMHRRLERQVGKIELGTPVSEINRMILELAAAIRAERVDARQGDFFTPALTHLLRSRINDALSAHGFTAEDVRDAGRAEGVDYASVALRVNDTFPWMLAVGMFPCVIDALPPLPPELQYRIIGDDLVLVDIHASLIVDILPGALTDLTVPFRWPQRGL